MLSIIVKEVNEFLNSLIAYVVLGVFLMGTGLVMWLFPSSSVLEYGYATLEPLFTLGPYLFMFLIPGITMRSFAEEHRSGTIELLFTLPFKRWEIVVGKFISAFLLVVFSILPTILYYFSVSALGSPEGNLDTAGIIGSYLGLILLGGVFTAFGLFASVLTENQIVSFVLAGFLCFLSYDGIDSLANLDSWGSWSYLLERVGILYHYTAMSKGLLDLKNIGYFVSVILLFLSFVQLTLTKRR